MKNSTSSRINSIITNNLRMIFKVKKIKINEFEANIGYSDFYLSKIMSDKNGRGYNSEKLCTFSNVLGLDPDFLTTEHTYNEIEGILSK